MTKSTKSTKQPTHWEEFENAIYKQRITYDIKQYIKKYQHQFN